MIILPSFHLLSRVRHLSSALFVLILSLSQATAQQGEITVKGEVYLPGETPPIWVSISGITGEALEVLHFDLYVQGFNFTNAESAQYLIAGSNNGGFQARATDAVNKHTLVSK